MTPTTERDLERATKIIRGNLLIQSDALVRILARALADERERAARIVEGFSTFGGASISRLAAAIRTRP